MYVLSSVLCRGVCVGVYTKSKTSELSPLRRKLLRFAKQFPPPLRSKNSVKKLVRAGQLKKPQNFGIFWNFLIFFQNLEIFHYETMVVS
jgi:hypothetical protein